MSRKLGIFADAMGPLGRHGLAAYATAKTTKHGTFRTTFKAPRGTVLVARTQSATATTDPGASCALQLG